MAAGRRLVAVWATPVAWAVLAAVAARLGRSDPSTAALAAALGLTGVGAVRAVAGSRGGLAGRAAELLLAGGALAWLLAGGAWLADLVALATPLAAAALAAAGVWPSSTPVGRRRLAGCAGLLVGLALLPGLGGAPHLVLKSAVLLAAAWLTARLLALAVPPALAAAAVLALGAALGAGHVAAWLLPPVAAAALLALRRDRPGLAAGIAVAAAALPPAGLALVAAVVAGAVVSARSARPLAALVPALALAWLRLPGGLPSAPGWPGLAAALPLAAAALPLLLPSVVLGLDRSRSAVSVAVGLACLPVIGVGPWLAAAAGTVWLLALPDGRTADARASATLPFSIAAAGTLLLLGPWDAAGVVPVHPGALLAGWFVAAALSLSGRPAARLAWLLPLAGLVWTLPVEGLDRHLAAGQTLRLEAPRGGGWAVLLAAGGGATIAPGDPLLAGTGAAPLRAGIDAPLASGPPAHPMWMVSGRGRGAASSPRGLALRRTGEALELEAAAPLVVRVEDLASWRRRRSRLIGLVGGALLLLGLAHLVPRARQPALAIGTGAAVATVVAAGSGVEPLALGAARGTADLALAVAACAAAAVLPALTHRRLLAGAVLLVPLALAQPLLRHPAGDEVYHLELLQSLAEDHDLAIANNLDRSNPDEAAYARHGDTLIHSPALALALLPGYLAGGLPGALVLLAVAMAAGAALAARRAEAIGLGRRTADLAWLAVIATYPAVTFATQIWPAAAGVLLVGIALQATARPSLIGAGAAAAASLVVKLRLGLVTLPVAAAAGLRSRGRGLLAAAAAVAGAVALVAVVFGGPMGRNRLAQLVPNDPGHALAVVWGLAWDAAGGLAFSAPLWLLALVGLPALWRRGGPGEKALLLGAGATVVGLLDHPDWFGGGSPPARYLVPLLPLALLGLAAVLGGSRGRRAARLLAAPAALLAWVAATRPLWLFNGGDGGWWLADALARTFHGAARALFPSVIRPDLATVAVPLAAVAAVLAWSRRPHRGAVAATVLALALAAAWTVGGREWRVEGESPQVEARGASLDPPPGTVGRASRVLGRRLPPGADMAVPWRPPLGRALVARLRVVGRAGRGELEASWDGAPAAVVEVAGGSWHDVELPPPPTLGRARLELAWRAADGTDVVVDRVAVR